MSGTPKSTLARVFRLALSGWLALTLLLPTATVTVSASEGDRTLYLHHTHTNETGRFTYKKDGKFDPSVLKELNLFLADWRTKEPTKMDPALFDLLWAVYRDVGASQPINIVSSYRTPATNAMLHKRSSAVAENSQHMKGKAIDFFIPGINLTKLRETVMRHQVGGVGYYPTSGSPFVHADTGSVRAWPRMTRAQLKKVFPDGRTLHVPTDGKVLSNEGRAYALAQWNECHAVPCNGALSLPAETMLASVDPNEAPIPLIRPADLGGGGEVIQVAALGGDPTQRVVPSIDIHTLAVLAPGSVTDDGTPIPARKSERMAVATLNTPAYGGLNALAAVDEAIGVTPANRPVDFVAAYVGEPDPGAQKALQMIIERETTGSIPTEVLKPATQQQPAPALHTASLGDTPALKGMFDLTFNSLQTTAAPSAFAIAVAGLAQSRLDIDSIETNDTDLVAPELDHVNETLVLPVAMSSEGFAVLTEAEGYLDKDTELGPMTNRLGFLPEPAIEASYDRFVLQAPMLVAN